MNDKKKVSQSTITNTVDLETGEVKEVITTKSFQVEKEPAYIKMYIEDIARLKEIPAGTQPILMELIRGMGYNNIIPAYRPIKEMMCANLGIKMDYLNKAINIFYKKGLIIRVHRGIYMADPELFARGRWEDIKNLRLIIEYKNDGTKKIKSNISNELQLKLGI